MMSQAFESEAALHAAVAAFLRRLDIPAEHQWPVGAGAADVMLALPSGAPWCLLELKNGLDHMDLGDAASYFEQALKYRLASGLPVFLGPFFSRHMGVLASLEGSQLALSCLAGRADVGLFYIHHVAGDTTNVATWYGFQMILRGTRVAAHDMNDTTRTVWPSSTLSLVDLSTAGSRKDRARAGAA